jgi:hypothetical protein
VIATRPFVRRRARRRTWRFYRDEVLPAWLIGFAAVVGPAVLWLVKVPG